MEPHAEVKNWDGDGGGTVIKFF